MALDRTAFDALVDSNGTPGHGTVWDKAAIDAVILDPVDEEITRLESSQSGTTALLIYQMF